MPDDGFSIRINRELGERLRAVAAEEGRTIKGVVSRALEAYIYAGGEVALPPRIRVGEEIVDQVIADLRAEVRVAGTPDPS